MSGTTDNTLPERISVAEAKDALLRSGYLLENRLEMTLRRKGYSVNANTVYPDRTTAKTRELDLYALTALKAGPEEDDFLWPVLLIECVNNPQPIAFITKKSEATALDAYKIKFAGLPTKLYSSTRHQWLPMQDFLEIGKYHHYCRGRIATQFCSFSRKGKHPSVWMASHLDEHFDSFRKLAVATEHYINDHYRNWRFVKGYFEPVNVMMFYPTVVVQGELFDVRQSGRSLTISNKPHLQYSQPIFVGTKETEYQIDVVTERFFSRYLRLIGEEVAKSARLLRRRHKDVRVSIDKIARTAGRFRSPEKIIAAMKPQHLFI